MSAILIRLPDELKDKVKRLAKKKNMSFNGLVNYWLQAAATQNETVEWMKNQLQGKDKKRLVSEFGRILGKTKPVRSQHLKIFRILANPAD